MTPTTGRRRRAVLDAAVLAAVTIIPQLLGGRGRVNADTKQYLYLDPGGLIDRARTLWDAQVGGGAVTHQAIGYLWPMGPYYWLTDQLGVPSWVAQRLWIGGLQFAAALGVLVLLRHLAVHRSAALVGAALYGLSPYVLGHVTGQSGLLLPYAALGWLVWTMARAVERGGWRWPAVFALTVTMCASLNGSSVFFVVVAATLWVPFAVWTHGHATPREGLAALVRAGVLTLATQLWWLVAYAVGGAYGLPILGVTEQVQTTSFTTSAAEVLRGLGYWFFYGADSENPWLSGLAPPYMESGVLISLSFAVPIAALALGAVIEWSSRTYFAVLVGLGTVIAVGAFPEPDRSPVGAAFEALSRESELVLSLRNTQRAGPLVALGLAGLAAGGLTALRRRDTRVAVGATVVLAALVALAFPAQWRSGLIAERFHRDEQLPAAWVEVGRHLDQGEGRVLEVPGIDFASYRWGHTLDPVSIGLTDRSIVARELVPMGGAAGVSLLGALDRSIQEGWAEPGTLAVVARLFGASEVLVRNDLEYERYRTVRPARMWDLVTDPASALELDETFGPREFNRANPRRPMIDEIELALDPDREPLPQLAVFDVADGDRPPVSAAPVQGAIVVDGDGEGIVEAAAAELIDGRGGPLLLGADVAHGPRFEDYAPEGTAFIVTDTNRKRGERWYALRENKGATEPIDRPAVLDDPTDARLDVVADQPDAARTVVEFDGAARVWATAYGSPLTLAPEERPVNAFDGDPRTAWLVDTFSHESPFALGIELLEPNDADHLVLVPPTTRPGARAVTRATVTLDGDRDFEVEVDEATARDPAGVRVELDGDPFTEVRIEIHEVLPEPGPSGFAEVRIPDVAVTEQVVLPTTVFDALGARVSSVPLAIVMSRHRADPSEPVRSDPEPSMQRVFELDESVALELRGTARLSARADETLVDPLVGIADPPRSSEFLPGDLGSRAAAAIDGDDTTAWRTPFVGVEGQWIDVPVGTDEELEQLRLTFVTDGRHSIPTSLRVGTDGGEPVIVAVPPIEPGTEIGATSTVDVPLPRPISGSRLQITIDAVQATTSPDWYTGDPVTLPVGIAEIDTPSAEPARPDDRIDTGCRDDLLRLDGRPVPIRITGSGSDALAGSGLSIESCGGPLDLAAGRHELRTVPGIDTGLDLDRLVLATAGFGNAELGPIPEVQVDSSSVASASATIESDGTPFWLVLDQSHNEGWELDLAGAAVDGPHPIDGHAAGWLVEPDGPGTLDARIRWAPQRAVDVALLASLLSVLGCLVLAVFAPGRRRVPASPDGPTLGVGPRYRVRPLGLVVTGAVAALVVTPLAAIPAVGLLVVAARWPLLGRLTPAVLVTAAATSVVLGQVRNREPAAFDWPQQFGLAHRQALLGVVLLGLFALLERRRAAAPDGDDR